MLNRIPLYLIIGFLGSGKTTLLQEIYRSNRYRRLIYLINDFSVRDVDAAIFSERDADVISVPGGSIFCSCLVTEFVSRLQTILHRQAESEGQFEGVVIEASGTANPSVISRLLEDSGLDQSFAIRSIICVTDPVTLPKLLHTLPNIRQQIACAEHIVLNKTDLVEPDELAQVEKQIREINPGSLVQKTVFCRIDFERFFSEHGNSVLKSDEPAHLPQAEYAKFSLQNRKIIDPTKLQQLIDDHPGQFYRIKGFVFDAEKRLLVIDYSVSSGLQIKPFAKEAETHLEFIFANTDAEHIRQVIKAFHKDGFT